MGSKKKFWRFDKESFVLVILLFISGVMLALSTGSFIVNFKQIGFSVLAQMQKGVYTVADSVKKNINAVTELHTLRSEYEALLVKIVNYDFLQRDNATIRKENERLKDLLNFSQSYEQKNIPAQVIGTDPTEIYSGVTINKGAKDGIQKGMGVISFQNGAVGLVGKIIEVGHSVSMIMPIYNFNYYVSSRIESSRDEGLISGQGSAELPLIMKYIKKRVLPDLQYGDVVVTSGINMNYIKDIPIGTISKINVLDYDMSLEIEIQPIIDFARLETVFVLPMNNSLADGE